MGEHTNKGTKNHPLGLHIRKITRFCSLMGLGTLLAVPLALFLFYGAVNRDLPQVLKLKDYRPSLKSKAFAENGQLIAEFGVESRIVLREDEIPKRVAEAFIAAEDKHFYQHQGIDFMGILSSLSEYASGKRESLRGASTLTQQLAKGLLVKKEGYDRGTARTISRKIKEAILALRLERHFKKNEILWMYLNEVYLGHGSYGVAAAAQNYFKKELKDLKLNEIALLAGLPQAPSRFSPLTNRKAALGRQAYVLGRMRDDGFISEAEHQEALDANKQLEVFARENNFRDTAPYFSEHIRRILIEKYGEKTLYEQGLEIYTTLDLDRELIMQRILKQDLIAIDKRQGFLGPLFRPQDEAALKKAKAMVMLCNKDDLLGLGAEYSLAWVSTIDQAAKKVFIEAKEGKGIIPLNAMAWARTRNPEQNYEAARLTAIGQTLKPGDVVLVKRQKGDASAAFYTLEQEPDIEGAMIAIEPSSGYVHAMQGGYSFLRSEFNRAFQACRQPGSVFKPIVYSAAIALKKYTPATLVQDTPLTFRDGHNASSWKPKNFEKTYKGEVTVREAVMNSMNVPTLNVVADLGIEQVVDWAHKMGINSKLKLELGTGIGSSCITPMELAKAFLLIANYGESREPLFIKEIIDRDQQRLSNSFDQRDPWIKRSDRLQASLENFFAKKERVMSEEDAFTMHFLLSEAAKNGTAQRSNSLQRSIAGKTGTTNDSYDTWFAGYSKELLSVVWVGNDLMNMPLGIYEQGGRTALPLFIDFYKEALKGMPNQAFVKPPTMCDARIDGQSGLRIEAYHPQSFMAPFRCGSEPALMPAMRHKNLDQALDMGGGF